MNSKPAIPWDDLLRLITLQDANTRVVLLGTALLGLASGVVGVFALLRKRALVGDALSHAALPGLCSAFLWLGYKSFFGLFLGATCSGIIAVLCIVCISRYTRVPEDAAIGIVLTSFFGLGICLSRVIQNHPNGMQAGLETFIYGKAASMLSQDAWLISLICFTVLALCFLLSKELKLICFDEEFARATGWPVLFLDILLMGCIVAVTMVGLQSVGVVLIISLLITPPAAARFWTHHLGTLLCLSAIFGALSALVGTATSALYAQLPTGPLIVITSALFFFMSSTFAPRRGLIARYQNFRMLQRKIFQQNFLRATYELLEERYLRQKGVENITDLAALTNAIFAQTFSLADLQDNRVLGSNGTKQTLARFIRSKSIQTTEDGFLFTKDGQKRALEVVRNHRLWELYLITFADIAPSHVDTSADSIEHVLSPDIIERLEEKLRLHSPNLLMRFPTSPHESGKFQREEKA